MRRSGTRRGAGGPDCGLGLRGSGKASCRRSHEAAGEGEGEVAVGREDSLYKGAEDT